MIEKWAIIRILQKANGPQLRVYQTGLDMATAKAIVRHYKKIAPEKNYFMEAYEGR